jgi:hypothetical protein
MWQDEVVLAIPRPRFSPGDKVEQIRRNVVSLLTSTTRPFTRIG